MRVQKATVLFLSLLLGLDLLKGNDDFVDRQILVGPLPVRTSSTMEGATGEPAEPLHDPGRSLLPRSRWFSWSPAQSGWVEITIRSDHPLDLAIYTGNEIQKLQMQRSAGPVQGFDTRLKFQAVSEVRYQIAVADYHGQARSFELIIEEVPERPINDDFANRIRIEGTDEFLIDATNAGATAEPGEPLHERLSPSRSLWWSYIPTVSQRMTIDYLGPPQRARFPGRLHLYTGSGLQDLQEINFGIGLSQAFDVEAGKSYFIVYDDDGHTSFSRGTGPGRVRLQLRPVFRGPNGRPANDDFAEAIDLTGIERITLSVEMASATREPLERRHSSSRIYPYQGEHEGLNSVWWTINPPEDTFYFVQHDGLFPLKSMLVYQILEGGAMRPVDLPNERSFVFPAKAGFRYYLAMVARPPACLCGGRISTETGTTTALVAKAPLASHPSIEEACPLARQENLAFMASYDRGEPGFYWHWTVPSTGLYEISCLDAHLSTRSFKVFRGKSEDPEDLAQPVKSASENGPAAYHFELGQQVTIKTISRAFPDQCTA